MGLRPDYRLTANGDDLTETIRARLSSLRLTDEAGYRSDELVIVLANHDPSLPIALPPQGAELELSLGYDGEVTRMGLYVVDELEVSGPPDTLTIKAKASPQTASRGGQSAMQTQKSRSWEVGLSLGDMVRSIAQEHGLKAAVDPALDSVALPHVDQVDESDLNLLTRISRDYDAIFKPGGGAIVVTKRGSSKSASGADLPAGTVTRSSSTRYQARLSKRWASGSVVAIYRDTAEAADVEVTVGSGEPVRRLRHRYSDEASARAAAQADLGRGARGERELRLTMPGDPTVQADARLTLQGFPEGVDGSWLVKRVVHTLDASGYRCDVEGEDWRATDEATGRLPREAPPGDPRKAFGFLEARYPWAAVP